jgi:hypothetical protein
MDVAIDMDHFNSLDIKFHNRKNLNQKRLLTKT